MEKEEASPNNKCRDETRRDERRRERRVARFVWKIIALDVLK
jgi:hypothetical protein